MNAAATNPTATPQIPNGQPQQPTPPRTLKLPDVVRIEDIEEGRVEPQAVFDELDALKAEINGLRNAMAQFVTALATVPKGQSQHHYYELVVKKLKNLQAAIAEYLRQYQRLVPLITVAEQRLGNGQAQQAQPQQRQVKGRR